MKKRILLVEDNPASRLVFQDLLEACGYEVRSVDNAEEGVTLARGERPDLILMDIQLPGMDGLTATRILREDAATRDVPIIALTSHAMPGDRERCLVAGCNGYITKPVRVREFRASLSKILGTTSGDSERSAGDEAVPSAGAPDSSCAPQPETVRHEEPEA